MEQTLFHRYGTDTLLHRFGTHLVGCMGGHFGTYLGIVLDAGGHFGLMLGGHFWHMLGIILGLRWVSFWDLWSRVCLFHRYGRDPLFHRYGAGFVPYTYIYIHTSVHICLYVQSLQGRAAELPCRAELPSRADLPSSLAGPSRRAPLQGRAACLVKHWGG